MTRDADFGVIASQALLAERGIRMAPEIFVFDMTAAGALQDIGDTGNWVWLPRGGRPVLIHMEHDASSSAADCRVDLSLNPANTAGEVFASTALTGASTGEVYTPMTGGCWARLRLGPNHTNGVQVTGALSLG